MLRKARMAKTLQIGDVTVHGQVLMAPMTGITDLPFRVLASRLGIPFEKISGSVFSARCMSQYSSRWRTFGTARESASGVAFFGASRNSREGLRACQPAPGLALPLR